MFWLLFGITFQFAFAEGFLLIVKHFLSEDPEALAKFPYVRIALYIFWAPFMIKNLLDYIKEWKVHNARKRLEKMVDAPKTAAAKAAAKAARGAAASAAAKTAKAAAQKQALERERAERDRQNREWQKRTTEEQRKQNQAAAKFCPHCGTRIVAGVNFCPICGGKQ